MVSIVERTHINAPVQRCFYLSLNIDLHQDSTAQTRERAVAGVTTGLIGLGERVTWRGRHFGVMLRHTSEIAAYGAPTFFEDVMVVVYFAASGTGTFHTRWKRHGDGRSSGICCACSAAGGRSWRFLFSSATCGAFCASVIPLSSGLPSQRNGGSICLITSSARDAEIAVYRWTRLRCSRVDKAPIS